MNKFTLSPRTTSTSHSTSFNSSSFKSPLNTSRSSSSSQKLSLIETFDFARGVDELDPSTGKKILQDDWPLTQHSGWTPGSLR